MADLYELQRAMRAMRQSALQRGALAILDLGSTKIGCLILRFDGLDPSLASDQVGSLAGQSSFQVVGSAITRSRGIEFGEYPRCKKQRGQFGRFYNLLRKWLI